MNKKLITIIGFVALFIIVIIFFAYSFRESGKMNDESASIVGEVKNNDFETYESKMGFSFEYPSQFYVMEDPEPFIPERLYVLVRGDEDMSGIIISTAENTDNQTPLEWLEGPYSGADLSNEHGTLDLDGQEAIFLDGGTWIVAVTPDNKYRLSFATLPTKDGDLLFLGMDTILSSFKFVR